MSRPQLAAASVLGLLLLATLTGCGGASDRSAAEEAPAPTATPTTSAGGKAPADPGTPSAVPESLDFAGTTVSGEKFRGASLAGAPTLLWFWAPWCPTCRSQVPQVERLASEYGGQLNVVGIGSLDSADAIADFARGVDGVTQLEDTEGELWRRFGIAEQSSFVLLDADGKVAFETGYGGSDELGDRVDDVVG